MMAYKWLIWLNIILDLYGTRYCSLVKPENLDVTPEGPLGDARESI